MFFGFLKPYKDVCIGFNFNTNLGLACALLHNYLESGYFLE